MASLLNLRHKILGWAAISGSSILCLFCFMICPALLLWCGKTIFLRLYHTYEALHTVLPQAILEFMLELLMVFLAGILMRLYLEKSQKPFAMFVMAIFSQVLFAEMVYLSPEIQQGLNIHIAAMIFIFPAITLLGLISGKALLLNSD